MPTCPNCGEIVMNGDPYCPNCGTVFKRQYEDNEDPVDDFKHFLNTSKDHYDIKKYESAFIFLEASSKIYKKMNSSEKSQLREMPFDQYWIVDLCCLMINNRTQFYWKATEFIKENRYSVRLCMDCDCVYPPDYKHCIKCGKSMAETPRKSSEKIADELTDLLSNKIYDDFEIAKLVGRSQVLMKSNDCRLVGIADTTYGIDFTFEKEHRYFKTSYICEYVPGSVRAFEDFTVKNDYTNLLSDESFKKLIKDTENKTGFTFKECSGGYGSQLDDNRFDFTFNDEINVRVLFDRGDGSIASYKIDLDSMELIGEYSVW